MAASRPRINSSRNKEQLVSNVKYNWHQGNYDAICTFLSGIDWLSVIHNNSSALAMWEVFMSILYAGIDMYVPCHSQSNVDRPRCHGYRTSEISRCTASKRRLWRKLKQNSHNTVFEPCIGNVHIPYTWLEYGCWVNDS